MKIGVDCDGVLTDMSGYIYEYGEKWFNRKPENPDGYSTAEIFGCTDQEEFLFGLRYFFTYCETWPPRPDAVRVNHLLLGDGHQVYEITARKFVTMKNPLGWYSRHVFEKWLRRHGFVFDGIHYCSERSSPEDKLEGCRRFAVDLMIDDKPEVALHLAENGMKVLLFDTRYNQKVKHENIVRVYDWNDIYEEIREIKKQP